VGHLARTWPFRGAVQPPRPVESSLATFSLDVRSDRCKDVPKNSLAASPERAGAIDFLGMAALCVGVDFAANRARLRDANARYAGAGRNGGPRVNRLIVGISMLIMAPGSVGSRVASAAPERGGGRVQVHVSITGQFPYRGTLTHP